MRNIKEILARKQKFQRWQTSHIQHYRNTGDVKYLQKAKEYANKEEALKWVLGEIQDEEFNDKSFVKFNN